jgi:hypothetical protein
VFWRIIRTLIHMRAARRFAWGVAALAAISGRVAAAQTLDQRQADRIEQALRQEGDAVVALADAAAGGRPLPSDFALSWHNDFLKARTGTFIPFVVGITRVEGRPAAALLYVRAARHQADDTDDRRPRMRRGDATGDVAVYPFEEIYPVDLAVEKTEPVRVTRGFSLGPGEYDLTVVVRERDREDERGRRRLASVVRHVLRVPDFSRPDLTTSSVMLADGLTVLREPPPPSEQARRPYVIGTRDIQLAADAVFRRSEELIVVFLVYNPTVTPEKHFDLEVEYHFFRKSSAGTGGEEPSVAVPKGLTVLPGERYFNRTEPQRFNPVVLGAEFDPTSGQPVMAGQGVSLAGFRDGDYRLSITVRDRVSGRTIERDVTFSVRS